MEINNVLHVCSLNCSSHVQLPFQSLLHSAQEALEHLFSHPVDLLRSIQGVHPNYPTQGQLFHARVVGLTLCKMYVSNLLLSPEKAVQVSCCSLALLFCVTVYKFVTLSMPDLFGRFWGKHDEIWLRRLTGN
jgi:hypothetical protein